MLEEYNSSAGVDNAKSRNNDSNHDDDNTIIVGNNSIEIPIGSTVDNVSILLALNTKEPIISNNYVSDTKIYDAAAEYHGCVAKTLYGTVRNVKFHFKL